MNKYIAFLRAINVGGTTIIKMSELKKTFESFGLENVQTYIQTGNVIFESQEKDAARLEEQIECQLEKASGKRIQLFVRTMREVVKMAEGCPFAPKDGETAYVVILDDKPGKKNVDMLLSQRSEADDFDVIGKEAYSLRLDRDKSVFTNNWIEKILGVAGTTRNLTTIKKLAEKYA
jgi:uncharacterized protein (DUF1697 family)